MAGYRGVPPLSALLNGSVALAGLALLPVQY